MREYIEKAMTFAEYEILIDGLLAEGKTTGTNQSEAMVNYGRLNRQRMHRLEKTVFLDEGVREAVRKVTRPMIWLIITCLLYTSPSPRDRTRSRMPSSA